MLWLKGSIILAIVLLLSGGGYYLKQTIEEKAVLETQLEGYKAQLEQKIKDIKEQQDNLDILNKNLEAQRKRKNKIIERIVTLDNRKESFITNEDIELSEDVGIEFKRSLLGITCETGNGSGCIKIKK